MEFGVEYENIYLTRGERSEATLEERPAFGLLPKFSNQNLMSAYLIRIFDVRIFDPHIWCPHIWSLVYFKAKKILHPQIFFSSIFCQKMRNLENFLATPQKNFDPQKIFWLPPKKFLTPQKFFWLPPKKFLGRKFFGYPQKFFSLKVIPLYFLYRKSFVFCHAERHSYWSL